MGQQQHHNPMEKFRRSRAKKKPPKLHKYYISLLMDSVFIKENHQNATLAKQRFTKCSTPFFSSWGRDLSVLYCLGWLAIFPPLTLSAINELVILQVSRALQSHQGVVSSDQQFHVVACHGRSFGVSAI
jgi:hypothetical protein